jgi:hypothetical protein
MIFLLLKGAITMKHRIKLSIITACAAILISHTHLALANTDILEKANFLLDWAENTYPGLFPVHQPTQNIQPWLFRHYPQTEIYAGVNTNDNNVYVLGGPWGSDHPTLVSSVSNLIRDITETGGDGSIPACDTADIPEGFVYEQSGQVVNITTNGECIKLPSDTNFCETPEVDEPTETGISVLTKIEYPHSEWRGVEYNNSFPDILSSFTGSISICTINAQPDQEGLIVNTDICLDLTEELQEELAGQEGVTITGPIEHATKSTMINTQVANCFNTDAMSVHDAYTGKTWMRIGDEFHELGGGLPPGFNY